MNCYLCNLPILDKDKHAETEENKMHFGCLQMDYAEGEEHALSLDLHMTCLMDMVKYVADTMRDRKCIAK